MFTVHGYCRLVLWGCWSLNEAWFIIFISNLAVHSLKLLLFALVDGILLHFLLWAGLHRYITPQPMLETELLPPSFGPIRTPFSSKPGSNYIMHDFTFFRSRQRIYTFYFFFSRMLSKVFKSSNHSKWSLSKSIKSSLKVKIWKSSSRS